MPLTAHNKAQRKENKILGWQTKTFQASFRGCVCGCEPSWWEAFHCLFWPSFVPERRLPVVPKKPPDANKTWSKRKRY